MDSELQRCESCGYQRHKAPSAYPRCCGGPMQPVASPDIWIGRLSRTLVAGTAAVSAEVVRLPIRRRAA